MKKTLLVVVAIVITGVAAAGVFVVAGVQCCHDNTASASITARAASHNEEALAAGPERISIYRVPLRCPLVAGLGCGSLAKPAMKELERQPTIAGAWLDHSGTTLAILWKENLASTERGEIMPAIFGKQSLKVNELFEEPREIALKDFLSGTGWYRTTAVDQLSSEEAQTVAARWVDKTASIIPLPGSIKDGLRGVLAKAMRRKFVGP